MPGEIDYMLRSLLLSWTIIEEDGRDKKNRYMYGKERGRKREKGEGGGGWGTREEKEERQER